MPDIVLKDRDGNPVTYPGVNAMELVLADGTTERFTAGGGGDLFINHMNDDGSELLYAKPIMYGDTAGDAIALGMMEEPYKESETAEHEFLGWSDSIGGEVKNSMFKNVTEDRTVYAVFKSTALISRGVCGDNAKWRLNVEGVLTVSGTGAMTDYTAATEQPWYDNAASITKVVLENGITHLGNYSFRDVTSLVSVELPDTLTTMGSNSLRNTGITSLYIPDGVAAIPLSLCYGCAALYDVRIPDSVTSIGNYAFYKCAALTSIDIPEGVTCISTYMLHGCTNLKNVKIPNSVISIENYAFQLCSALVSVTLPNSVTSIGNYAFEQCKALTGIIIPNSVTSIGNYAFANCIALTSITLGENVQSVGDYAFMSASKLTSIIIPSSVTSIGYIAFAFSGITSVTFKDTTTWYVTQTKGATSGTTLSSSSLANKSTAATYLSSTYAVYYWYKT